MKYRTFLFLVIFSFGLAASSPAQNSPTPGPYPPQANPMDNISQALSSISRSVKTLNQNMNVFIEKLSGGVGDDRHKKILIGLQILNEAEKRLATLQSSQISLVEKQVPTRSRLIQIEQELRPESTERATTYLGTTRTDEFRENRKRSLETERASLQALLTQIESTLAQTSSEVRGAQVLVTRLRRQFLPLIDSQISDAQ